MKKILFGTIAAVLLIFTTSCEPTVSGYDFNETIKADKALVMELSGADSVKFCEAQGQFLEPFNKDSKKYEVIWVMTVFQVDSLVYTFTHDTLSADPIINKYNDIWLGDLYSPVESTVSLKEAINRLRASEMEIPESPKFVLRKPITPPPFPENKLYIFGSTKSGFIKVDSETGEVSGL